MAAFLQITDLYYSVNLDAATTAQITDNGIQLFFPPSDTAFCFNEAGDALDGVEIDYGFMTNNDLQVTISPVAEKYESVKRWVESNTL